MDDVPFLSLKRRRKHSNFEFYSFKKYISLPTILC